MKRQLKFLMELNMRERANESNEININQTMKYLSVFREWIEICRNSKLAVRWLEIII